MATSVAVLLVVGCRIPDEHFNLRDGSTGDSGDASGDGPLAPLGKVFVTSNSGIHAVQKDPSGHYTGGQPQAGGSWTSPVLRSDGLHLYALIGGNRLAHFAIERDGSLTQLADSQTLTGTRVAIHPSGAMVVVNGTATFNVIAVGPDGGILGATPHMTANAQFIDVGFAQAGNCLLLVSAESPPNVYSIKFSPTQVATQYMEPWVGMSGILAVHPNASTAYVASSNASALAVQQYAITSDCQISRPAPLNARPIAEVPGAMVVDPNQTRLYVLGHQVSPYQLGSSGEIGAPDPASVFQDPGFSGGGLAVDPAEPDMLYVTGPGFRDGSMKPGVTGEQIDGANSHFMPKSSFYFVAMGATTTGIVLAP